MSLTMRTVVKDAGAAFAVLAIYLLMLLVPVHQSAASQSSFADLGYETFGAWSLCAMGAEADGERDSSAVNVCPVAGISKQTLGLSPVEPLIVPSAYDLVAYVPTVRAIIAPVSASYARPRAPPALV